MANTVVKGKGTPQQIGGSLSDGIFFQNLGTSPVYIGYGDQTGAAVNSGACDGVLQAGGTFSVGGKRSVWLYADVDTPVVYNYDATASADGGSNVNVAGSVAVTNTPGVTVNGNVALASGTAVGVNGNVNVKNLNQWDLLQSYLNYSWLGANTSGPSYITNDISKYATLAINYQWGGNSTFSGYPTIRCRIRWIDASGNYVLDQTACTWGFYGLGVWHVPIRGTFAQIDFFIDKSRTGNIDLGNVVIYIGASLDAVPERYVNDPNGAQANIKLYESPGGVFGYSNYAADLTDGNTYNFQTGHSASARVIWELPSIAGPMSCMFFGDNLGSGANYDIFIGSVARNQALVSHDFDYFLRLPQTSAVLGRVSANWQMIAPKKPLLYDLGYYGTAPGSTVYPTLAVTFGG